MKMKFITAVVAFSIAFGFSTFLAEFLGANNQLNFYAHENNRTAQEISSFLEQDVARGEESNEVCQSTDSLSECAQAISDYVEASESVEDVNLPPDFRFAWQAHLKAWREHADFLESSSFSVNKINKAQFSVTYARQSGEIDRTWFNVLSIAKKYDAIIPPNAY